MRSVLALTYLVACSASDASQMADAKTNSPDAAPDATAIDAGCVDQAENISLGVNNNDPGEYMRSVLDARDALAAAKLDVSAARAAFYPSFEIGAELGYQSFEISKLISTPASVLYNLAAELTVPLLNRRELTGTYFAKNATQIQAVYQYEQAILRAYIEVFNQVKLIRNLGRSFELREREVETLVRSVETSSLLFRSARAEYMEVLLTTRDSLESQMELVESRKSSS